MLREVVAAVAPRAGDAVIDATFGWGGYTRGFLEAADCVVYGIDRDPGAASRAGEISAAFPGRFTFMAGRFGDMEALAEEAGLGAVNGIAFDLGVSSMQIDDPERGFSFQKDGPLDMRMDGAREEDAPTAADVVNGEAEADLARILWLYGEERHSRRIARAIVSARRERPIDRTLQLAEIVARASGGGRADKIHPATRTFQALRIYVNDELGQLEAGLRAAERLLAPEGRLAVVSFHSLEDRIVKNFLRERGGLAPAVSRHLPEPTDRLPPSFHLPSRSAAKPREDEVAGNPRARSARLRAAVRTGNAPWPGEGREAA
jgi:16S rRNA (cytosine1402-N4)-methyltransferase